MRALIRNLLPPALQVPVRYYFNSILRRLESEFHLLPMLVKSGDQVVDIGGNRGLYAYRLWAMGAIVDVFEPNPNCIDILQKWARGRVGISVHSVGLSDHAGTATLHIPRDTDGTEHDASATLQDNAFEAVTNITVTLRTLDDYSFNHVKFIKIDVEGHESSVLRGSEKTLRTYSPSLLVEIEQRHNKMNVLQIFEQIESMGYTGFFYDNFGLRSIKDFSAERDQDPRNLGRARHCYINNFLFLADRRIASGEYRNLPFAEVK